MEFFFPSRRQIRAERWLESMHREISEDVKPNDCAPDDLSFQGSEDGIDEDALECQLLLDDKINEYEDDIAQFQSDEWLRKSYLTMLQNLRSGEDEIEELTHQSVDSCEDPSICGWGTETFLHDNVWEREHQFQFASIPF